MKNQTLRYSIEDAKKFKDNISIKKCKTFRGHDGDGYKQCDVMFDGKVFAEMHEGGWGGGYMYNSTNKEVFDVVIKAFKLFPKELEYGLDDDLDFLIDDLFQQWLLNKDVKKGILIKTGFGWSVRGAKETIPTTLKKFSNGLEFYQKLYDEIKGEGKEILNTEYLKSIGVSI